MKKLKRTLIIALLIPALVCAAIYSCILYSSFFSKPQKSDVIIVLGAQVVNNTPKLSLQYRLEKALKLYNEKYAPYIIVSGGQGKDETSTEASVMKAWLVKRGVAASRVFEEDKSHSTYENIKLSKIIMEREKFKNAVIVSNDFHIFRALKTARKLGISATGAPAPTVYYTIPYYHAREVLSVIKSIALNR